MVTNRVWIENIIVGLKDIADPIQGFINYQFAKLYTMYRSFFEHIMVYLYDDMIVEEFLDHCKAEQIISKKSFESLQSLDILLNKFFDEAKELTDFEVIRRPEWDQITPEAKKCIEYLEKDLAMMKD